MTEEQTIVGTTRTGRKALTFVAASAVAGLLALGSAPLAFAVAPADPGANANGGQSATAPNNDNANGGRSATAPNSDNADAHATQDNGRAGGEHASATPAAHPDANHGDTPPGNNGTIKIHDAANEDTNANEPHVSCDFWVDFYGYDAGHQTATMEFQLWAPTEGGTTTRTTDWTTADRTGGNQLDKEYGPVDLSGLFAGVTPHPRQGYHVRLTVHVTGSQGSDVKHKVFWVEPCAPTTAAAPLPGGTTETVSNEHLTRTESTGVVGAVSASGSAPAPMVERPATEVLGVHYSKAGSPAEGGTQVLGAQYSRGGSLARTGIAAGILAGLAALLLAGGVALVRFGRRQRAEI